MAPFWMENPTDQNGLLFKHLPTEPKIITATSLLLSAVGRSLSSTKCSQAVILSNEALGDTQNSSENNSKGVLSTGLYRMSIGNGVGVGLIRSFISSLLHFQP